MELVIALVIIGVGLIWYYNAKSRSAPAAKLDQNDLAPYKIESPEVTPVVAPPEPSKPADDRVEAAASNGTWPFPTPVVEAKPVKPAVKAKSVRAKKTAEPKKPAETKAKPAAMTAAPKKPRAKKPTTK